MSRHVDTDSATLCENCLQSCWKRRKQGYRLCRECAND